jgi:hypothetical protein
MRNVFGSVGQPLAWPAFMDGVVAFLGRWPAGPARAAKLDALLAAL